MKAGSEREHRGGYTQEADPVRGVCGAHGHGTAEVRDVRRTDGGRGLRGGGRIKSGWGVSWTTSELSVSSTPTSRRLQPRTMGNGARRRNKGWNVS